MIKTDQLNMIRFFMAQGHTHFRPRDDNGLFFLQTTKSL